MKYFINQKMYIKLYKYVVRLIKMSHILPIFLPISIKTIAYAILEN